MVMTASVPFGLILIFAGVLTPSPTPATAPPAPASPAVLRSALPSTSLGDPYARQVFDLINTQRAAAMVGGLRWNQTISDVSQQWANHLGSVTQNPGFDFASIHRPDGGSNEIPAGADWYGEVISFNFSATEVVNWWMNSVSHRTALLDPRDTDIGIGFVVPTAGPYAGWHLVVANTAGYPSARTLFVDVGTDDQFASAINWMASSSISTGWTEANGTRTFRPQNPVTRDAMAAFLYRLAGSPVFTPPSTSLFADVHPDNPYYKEIMWLAATGISTGWEEPDGTKTFRPLNPIARDAMAAFLFRMAGSPRYSAPARSPFPDVSPDAQFYPQIAWMKSNGISSGWPEGDGSYTYRPAEPVSRNAVAAFLYAYAEKFPTPK